jgi:hypothetical protein
MSDAKILSVTCSRFPPIANHVTSELQSKPRNELTYVPTVLQAANADAY